MLDMTSFEPALKQHYTDWRIEDLVYKNHPLLALINKYEGFGGDVWKVPLKIGNPQNRSASFAKAIAGTTNSELRAFLMTRKSNYSIAEIQNEVLEASEGDSNAFLRAATTEIDGALAALANDIGISLYRNGTGAIGRVGSGTTLSGSVIELADPEDVTNFEVGMKLVFAVANTGTITVKATSSVENVVSVIAVDRANGEVTVSAALDSFGSNDVAALDYIFIQGDVSEKMSGLQAWLPYGTNRATELAASFYGVTRSADSTRLGGVVYDGTAQTIEEAMIDHLSLIAREGGAPDYYFVNHKEYRNLIKSLGSKVQYCDVKAGSEGHIGFKGIWISGSKGDVKVIADQSCPVGRGFPVQMDTLKLGSLGKVARIFQTDGTKLLRSSTADALQIRCVSYGNLACNAPGFNGQTAFAANNA